MDDRLGLIAPITNPAGTVVGALVLETRLGPIVDLVEEYEGSGETSEAHIAQPTTEGDAEFITLLRFERDAAYSVVVPATKGLPINQSLLSPDGNVVCSPNYRSIDSVLAIETIDATGWGLVVKIDASEAFAPAREVQWIVGLGAAAAIGGERSLQHRADHDDLTGLSNRQYATTVLTRLMADSSGSESSIVVQATDLGLALSNIVVETSEETAELDWSIIEELRATGVGIAVDDVGLHYSNLDRLVEVRPDIAKIDRRWLGDPAAHM